MNKTVQFVAVIDKINHCKDQTTMVLKVSRMFLNHMSSLTPFIQEKTVMFKAEVQED